MKRQATVSLPNWLLLVPPAMLVLSFVGLAKFGMTSVGSLFFGIMLLVSMFALLVVVPVAAYTLANPRLRTGVQWVGFAVGSLCLLLMFSACMFSLGV